MNRHFPCRSGPALRFERQARVHIGQLSAALARDAIDKGAVIFEDTPVLNYHDGVPCEIETVSGLVKANEIILATHTPIGRILSIQGRLMPKLSYLMAFRTSVPFEDALYWDLDSPYHYIREIEAPDGDGLSPRAILVGGADHWTGQSKSVHIESLHRLWNYVDRYFDPGEILGVWVAQYFDPADGLPYIGKVPGMSHVYLGTGFSGTRLTMGALAGRELSELLNRRNSELSALLSPSRTGPLSSLGSVISTNYHAVKHFVGDRWSGEYPSSADDLEAGSGTVIRRDGELIACYRDDIGVVHELSPVCTHANCIVHWNGVENTWDCPCHGTRYRANGEVLEGPATMPLEIHESKERSTASPTTPALTEA